jgi:hypothetical protein
VLSPLAVLLTRISAVLFAVLGSVLFVAPQWSSERFGWKVGHFVAMTIGGWSIGTAAFAWLAAGLRRWDVAKALLVYLWAFPAGELIVVLWHRDGLRLGEALAWPYLLTLGVSAAAAVVGLVDIGRQRPVEPSGGPPARNWIRGLSAFFVVFVGFLATVALIAPKVGRDGRIFPDPLTPFTLRAFGAFYLALALAAVPLVGERALRPMVAFMWAGLALIVPITAAAFFNLHHFDFGEHPGGLLYIAAYLAAGIGAVAVIASYRSAGGEASPVGLIEQASAPPEQSLSR